MWRFCGIVIFSALCVAQGSAATIYFMQGSSPRSVHSWGFSPEGGGAAGGSGSTVTLGTSFLNKNGTFNYRLTSSSSQVSFGLFSAAGSHWVINVSDPSSGMVEYTASPYSGGQPVPSPTPTPTPSPTPDDRTSSYEYFFGPEYEGATVVVRDQFGNVLQEVVVGPGGVDLSGEVVFLNGEARQFTADIYRPDVEGAPVLSSSISLGSSNSDGTSSSGGAGSSSWTETGEGAPSGSTFDRNGNTYVSNGDGTWSVTSGSGGSGPGQVTSASRTVSDIYGGGQWSVVNAQGGVMATGVIPNGGGSIDATFTVLPGENFTFVVQPLVIGGDGTPALGEPVQLGPPTVGPQPVPSPTPVATPSPTPTPSPNPEPSVPVVLDPGAGGSAGPGQGTDQLLELPDPDDYGEVDDGEEAALEKAQGIADKWAGISALLQRLQSALSGIGQMFDRGDFNAGDPGTVCTIAMGPASIDLSPYSGYRAATAAFAYGLGAMVVYSIAMAVMRK